MNGIIGHNGLVGNYLKTEFEMGGMFNSKNIETLPDYTFDTLYIAAPTGNRLKANSDSGGDLANIKKMLKYVERVTASKVVLISTVDAVLRHDMPYGSNRRYIEEFVSQRFDTSILRLSSLIHSSIVKNPLFDLKHQKFLDSINLNLSIQWYDLNNLKRDILFVTQNHVAEYNLVSEPILNKEIVERFFPNLALSSSIVANKSITPYIYTKDEIFIAMEKYLYA
jgi:hypothetical protein